MEKIKVLIDGVEIAAEAGTELLSLVDRYSINYMDNPIAAAYVNGSIVSLREKLEGNAEIKTIRTISPIAGGKAGIQEVPLLPSLLCFRPYCAGKDSDHRAQPWRWLLLPLQRWNEA